MGWGRFAEAGHGTYGHGLLNRRRTGAQSSGTGWLRSHCWLLALTVICMHSSMGMPAQTGGAVGRAAISLLLGVVHGAMLQLPSTWPLLPPGPKPCSGSPHAVQLCFRHQLIAFCAAALPRFPRAPEIQSPGDPPSPGPTCNLVQLLPEGLKPLWAGLHAQTVADACAGAARRQGNKFHHGPLLARVFPPSAAPNTPCFLTVVMHRHHWRRGPQPRRSQHLLGAGRVRGRACQHARI